MTPALDSGPRTKPVVIALAGRDLFVSFFGPAEQRRLSAGFEWVRVGGRRVTPSMRRQLERADGLITTWDSPAFDESLLATAPRLRIIAHCGGEVKSRFSLPLFRRLTITNAADPMARHVAELAAAFLLYEARNIDRYRAELRRPASTIYGARHLHGVVGESLLDATVGLIGFGRIGRALVELLVPFGIRFVVFDPYARRDLPRGAHVEFAGLESALRSSRLLVLAAALNDETRNLLDRRRLLRLRRGTSVINVARGGLVDLEALTSLVVAGRLRCALDVTDPLEPLPDAHRLRHAPGAVLTPHVGAGADAVRRQMAAIVIDELERRFDGRRPRNGVTPAMLATMT